MSSNNDGGDNNNALSLLPVDGLDLQLTNEDVDDALNFDLDFDAMAETMGDALPDINLDDMGSLGTRSPSPSESASVTTKGSKRSRAEFDTDSECDSSFQRDGPSKRMVLQTGFAMSRSGSGLGFEQESLLDQVHQTEDNNIASHKGTGSPTRVIRRDREQEGRCPDCGLDTHRIVMTDNGFEMQALTIEGEVLNGRCLLCDPLKEGESMENLFADHKPMKKGGRKNGESSASKKKGGRRGEMDNESETLNGSKSKSSSHHPPSRGNTTGSSNMNTMSPSHQQQRQMLRNMQQSPNSGNLPFPPPGRDSRRPGKFTPTPSQYHSKMALMKQEQLPRKHSATHYNLVMRC